MTNFQSKYQNFSDEELLHLWGERSQLLEEAQSALASEISNRGLSKRAEKRSSIRKEAEKDIEKPRATLSQYAPLAIIPICALAAWIVFFLLPMQLRDRWGNAIYVIVTCFAITLLTTTVRPEGLFRKRISALLGWVGLLTCAAVATVVVKLVDAGGRVVFWRGRPMPAGLFYGMVAFFAAYYALFFGFRMFRPRSAKGPASRGGRE